MPEKESREQKRRRAAAIMMALREHYGPVSCTLNYRNPWELLVGAILAAQCTDARVNRVTETMFEEWPDLSDYSSAPLEAIEERVQSCGLFHNKAKSIKASAERLLEAFDGEVPQEMGELLSLPGVGRKIANLIRGDAYGIPGIVVDTHCGRISGLLGLCQAKEAPKIEKELADILEEVDWTDWGHYLVNLGRDCCKARCRQCLQCPLREHCVYAQEHADSLKGLLEAGDRDVCC